MSLITLADHAAEVDGVAPLNEASLLALGAGTAPRVLIIRTQETGTIIAAAFAVGDAPVEVMVDPDYRRVGIGREIVAELIADGESSFWAHGDLPAAAALARSAGLTAQRTLLVLRLTMVDAPDVDRALAGITLRSYQPSDADTIIAINARAFADHPEQGSMDRAEFERRTASDWFEPAGLFVAERDGRIVGFHWTKIEGEIGEVYVIGIDPEAQGIGLGKALTTRGIRHMYDQGLRIVDLYVEGDNFPALALYKKLGFKQWSKDTLYAPR